MMSGALIPFTATFCRFHLCERRFQMAILFSVTSKRIEIASLGKPIEAYDLPKMSLLDFSSGFFIRPTRLAFCNAS